MTFQDDPIPDGFEKRDAEYDFAKSIGCTHRGTNSVITRPDAQGYAGGETITIGRHYGSFVGGQFREAFMVGGITGNVHDFRRIGGRQWHPDQFHGVCTEVIEL